MSNYTNSGPFKTAGDPFSQGAVIETGNADGTGNGPVTAANPLAVTDAALESALAAGTDLANSVSGSGSFNAQLVSASPFYVAGKTLFLTGIVIVTAANSSDVVVLATIQGLLGGQLPVAVEYPASGYKLTPVQFSRAIPASAVGTPIYVSLPGPTGIAAIVYLQGFYK